VEKTVDINSIVVEFSVWLWLVERFFPRLCFWSVCSPCNCECC